MNKTLEVFGYICIALGIVAILLSAYDIGKSQANSDKLCVPKISGIYTPMDNSQFGIIVLNVSDQYEKQLFASADTAMKQVRQAQLNQGGIK